uniref:DNA cytosine methyltransferase n=1 Tax=Candidatus Limisoma sp. TaxID=3076476 RepID=UPI003FEDB5D4
MKHLELFAGIGGFRRATDLLASDGIMNFESIGFSEIDPKAITTYKSNFDTSNDIEIGDIVSFTENKNLSSTYKCNFLGADNKQ